MRWCQVCNRPWSLAYCGAHSRRTRQTTPQALPPSNKPCAAPVILDRVYRALLAELSLSPHHRQALQQRGLNDTEIVRRCYKTLPLAGRAALARRLVDRFRADVCAQVPGFYMVERDAQRWWSLAGAVGLLVPVCDLKGHIVALKVRADDPGDGPKYTTVSSARHDGPSPGAHVHVPLYTGSRGETVRMSEGEFKSDVATLLSGILTLAVPGVSMWRKALPLLQALQPQRVLLAFDADWRSNPHVAQALGATAFALVKEGFAVWVEVWEPALGKGIDDLLTAGHTPTLKSAALAFGSSLRGRARVWRGTLATTAAEEIPRWY